MSEAYVVDKNLGQKLEVAEGDLPTKNADGEPIVELTDEQKYLFDTRGWLLVGHESLIPKPNDYFVSRMGTESVILTRNKQGEILGQQDQNIRQGRPQYFTDTNFLGSLFGHK